MTKILILKGFLLNGTNPALLYKAFEQTKKDLNDVVAFNQIHLNVDLDDTYEIYINANLISDDLRWIHTVLETFDYNFRIFTEMEDDEPEI